METINYYSRWAGPCVKAHVVATLIAKNGKRYVSSNFCLTPQDICPRADKPSGEGYKVCKSICNQPSHAEVSTLFAAKGNTVGSTMYVEYTWVCQDCKEACEAAGVKEIILGRPPEC